ncbi:MAG: hypothetical protein IH903_08050 [Proteobacteria bacterium]|nr:hypothetical protein [Pseudomonadota bacterium]
MKMKAIAVGLFRVLAVLFVLLLLVVVGLTLPECSRLLVTVVNNTPKPVEEVTLKLGGEIIWSGKLAGLRGKRISVLRRLNGSFAIKGRYGGTGRRFEGTYGYATAYLSGKNLLLIENDGVRYASWRWSDIKSIDDMTFWDNAKGIWKLGLMFMSCADYDLWMALKN